jgi:hypothetical protein
MPRAIPVPVRRAIAERRRAGQALTTIALELGLAYGTVRHLWRRYRRHGKPAWSAITIDAGGRAHLVRRG